MTLFPQDFLKTPQPLHKGFAGLSTHMAADRRILLAGVSVRSLAASAIRAGLIPWCLDCFGDADLRESLDRAGGRWCGQLAAGMRGLPAACADIDPAVPIVCAGGVENDPEVLDQLRQQRRVCNASSDAIRAARQVETLFTALQAEGIPVPEIRHALSGGSHDDWLRKPRRSGGGLGIVRAGPEVRSCDESHYFQRCVAGVAVSALYAVRTAEPVRVLGTALQFTGWDTLGGSGFQYCGAIAPFTLTSELTAELQRIADAVSRHCGLVGVFGIDFILRAGKLWLIEVNPRLTATHELHETTSQSPLRAHLECFGVELPEAPPEPLPDPCRGSAGAMRAACVVYARHDIPHIDDLGIPRDWIVGGEQAPQFGRCRIRIADIPARSTTILAYQPLCSLLIRFDGQIGTECPGGSAELPGILPEHVGLRQVIEQLEEHLVAARAELRAESSQVTGLAAR